MNSDMTRLHKFPKDLADLVYESLPAAIRETQRRGILAELFETMFLASLQTDEARPTTFELVYLDPNESEQADRIPRAYWQAVRIARRRFTVAEAVKLSQATDARSSALAVYADDKNVLYVWGLVDLANRFRDFISYETISSADRPGVFQASVDGIGRLSVYVNAKRIGELSAGEISTALLDPLELGFVRRLLNAGIEKYIADVEQLTPPDVPDYRGSWRKILTDLWISSIKRILLRVQGFGHGGAFVITSDSELKGLDVKYPLVYERFERALISRGVAWKSMIGYQDEILELDSKRRKTIPSYLVDKSLSADVDYRNTEDDLSGIVWFVALLSRVDGCVVLDSNLVVRGFGAVIKFEDVAPEVRRADTADADEDHLGELDIAGWGSRHRSMMRYCYSVPGSVGIVVSQDRDVRVMTRVRERLVVWDGINLQRIEEFIAAKPWSVSGRSRIT